MRTKPTALLAVTICFLSVSALLAAPGTITATSSASAVSLGDTFAITLRIAGYTDATEIDGYNFRITYDSSRFSFVSGSLSTGTGAGVDQQWLSKANQEAAPDFSLDSSGSSTATPGVVVVAIFDEVFAPDPERGTVAADGFLVSFSLMANSVGAGAITPAPFPDGSVLFDVDLAETPVDPAFVGTFVTVVPEPQPFLLIAAGLIAWLALRRRN